jgi:hypothetical protein
VRCRTHDIRAPHAGSGPIRVLRVMAEASVQTVAGNCSIIATFHELFGTGKCLIRVRLVMIYEVSEWDSDCKLQCARRGVPKTEVFGTAGVQQPSS